MFHVRLKLVALTVLAGMAIIGVRLGQMQLLMGDFYREEGRRRRIRQWYPNAPRGKITARDGTILAEDQPVRSVAVILRDIELREDTAGKKERGLSRDEYERWCAAVAEIAGDTVEGLDAELERVRAEMEEEVDREVRREYSKGPGEASDSEARKARRFGNLIRRLLSKRPHVLYEDVAFNVAARAEVASVELPGLMVTESMKRKYPEELLAAHVLGYVGKITPKEYDLYRDEYEGDERKRVAFEDVMGRAGIERRYNSELRGQRGWRREVVNARREPQKVLSDLPAVRGATIRLAIDPALQRAAERELERIFVAQGRPGAAVCMDVWTGEVLAMASWPTFDPGTFRKEYGRLSDPDELGKYRPLLNRAFRGRYPPGSVFKVVTATAALETGAIAASTQFTCNGVFHLPRVRRGWLCHRRIGHGTIGLHEGIQKSCNVYFYNTGLKAGGSALVEWAARYGFGQPTGIDFDAESARKLDYPRRTGDVVNLSIGQGSLTVTPLQVCGMMAAVANGGELLRPRLRLGGQSMTRHHVGFTDKTLADLRRGLYLVVNEKGGTGYKPVRSREIVIAGKTGTAQAGTGREDHAWFAGYAPFDDPAIAFAVVIEHGGHGGATAGPVAKAIAEAWAKENTKQ